jgi:uncharacterized membrane protein YhaH (DUF805 family)
MSVSLWDAAAAGDLVVSIIALKVLWIICLVTVKRRKDRLRLPFLWLKCAIPLFILCVKPFLLRDCTSTKLATLFCDPAMSALVQPSRQYLSS